MKHLVHSENGVLEAWNLETLGTTLQALPRDP